MNMTHKPQLALETPQDALEALEATWPLIVSECRAVLGSELHYQAMIYHCFRTSGVPVTQIGMNVKQWIAAPVSPLFNKLRQRKVAAYQGGFEPIPDVVLFSPDVKGDWRRRNRDITLHTMLAAIEIKASERASKRLGRSEIFGDIKKLAAQRDEVRHLGADMAPVMMVIDTAPLANERMRPAALAECQQEAEEQGVSWLYMSPEEEQRIIAP